MSWARVDDGMLDHAKWQRIEALGERAWSECVAVWLAVNLHACRTSSDGAISWTRLDRLTPLGKRARGAAEHLLAVGLMDRDADGVRLHDYLDYNASASERAEKTAAKTRRQKRWRDAHVDASTEPSTPASTGESTVASTDASLARAHLRDASRAQSPSPSPSPSPSHSEPREISLVDPVAGVPDAREAAVSDDQRAHRALASYMAAEEAAGSLCSWTTGSAYGQLVTVHRLAEAQAGRTGQSVADVLAAWARRYVAERQKRHPRWWLDCVNDWLAAPAKPTMERRGSLPVATREELLNDEAPEGIL